MKKFSTKHQIFLAAVTTKIEPTCYSEAAKDARWREAMRKEIEALENNDTWMLVTLPQEKKSNRVQMGVQNKVYFRWDCGET